MLFMDKVQGTNAAPSRPLRHRSPDRVKVTSEVLDPARNTPLHKLPLIRALSAWWQTPQLGPPA